MLLDQATDTQIQAARMLGGATMVAFLAARMFRGHAQRVRLVVVGLYIAGVLGFVVYVLI
jgi:glycerol uptake facilitator-like aquaporin